MGFIQSMKDALSGGARGAAAEVPKTLDALIAENQELGRQVDALRARRAEIKREIDAMIFEREAAAARDPRRVVIKGQ